MKKAAGLSGDETIPDMSIIDIYGAAGNWFPAGGLLPVPVADADVDGQTLEGRREHGQVLAAVVIRIDDLRTERLDGVSRFRRRHGVRQVHRNERDVDVRERAHLRRAFRVAGNVNPLAADRQDIAVAPPLLVKELTSRRPAREVVHRD